MQKAIVRKRDFKCSAADRAVKVQDSIFESPLSLSPAPRKAPFTPPYIRGSQLLAGGDREGVQVSTIQILLATLRFSPVKQTCN